MALRVRLLGRPAVERDGVIVRGPRGRKCWALLAVLLLAERPMSRRSLASLLFPDAADPLGALRWTLSQLRRGLPGGIRFDGDPVAVRVDPQCRVDVLDLLTGRPDQEWDRPGPPETLLDGADGAAGPDFDLWLTAARHRVGTAQGARLRDAATRALDETRPAAAVTAATRALMVAPYEPAAQANLVGSLVAAGDHAAAMARLREWSTWIRCSRSVVRSSTPWRHTPPKGSRRCGRRRGWPGVPVTAAWPPRRCAIWRSSRTPAGARVPPGGCCRPPARRRAMTGTR